MALDGLATTSKPRRGTENMEHLRAEPHPHAGVLIFVAEPDDATLTHASFARTELHEKGATMFVGQSPAPDTVQVTATQPYVVPGLVWWVDTYRGGPCR